VEDAPTYEAVRMLMEAGNQVLVIENPLTDSYMAQMPKSAIALFEAEAEVVLAAIDAYAKAHQREFRGIHLIGASYVAFIGAIAAAKDSEKKVPLITGQTTLLFPPVDMAVSVKLLDNLIGDIVSSALWIALT